MRRGKTAIVTGDHQEVAKSYETVIFAKEELDLADLESVYQFSKKIIREHSTLDLLVNNREIKNIHQRELSVDGFEKTFATNYLGHFALTAYLFPLLKNSPGAEILCHCDLSHLDATIDFADLQGERNYIPEKAYGQSMLALLLFSGELERRIKSSGLKLKSYADDKINSNWARPETPGIAYKLWQISEDLTGADFVFEDSKTEKTFYDDFILPSRNY